MKTSLSMTILSSPNSDQFAMGTPSSSFPPFFGPGKNDDHPSFDNQSDPNAYNINNKIMLTAIMSLSLVIVLVIILHLYARCALSRHAARRRAAIQHLGLTTASQAHSPEPPKTGLDPSVIAALPIFAYKQIELDGDQNVGNNNPAECAVCLSFLEDQEMARLLPNCKHTFHAECIDKWLNSRSTCPICRTEVEPRWIEPEPREGPVVLSSEAPRLMCVVEGSTSSDPGNNQSSSSKLGGGGSSSRLSSFRRMLSRERSSRRIQYEVQEEGFQDLERQ